MMLLCVCVTPAVTAVTLFSSRSQTASLPVSCGVSADAQTDAACLLQVRTRFVSVQMLTCSCADGGLLC